MTTDLIITTPTETSPYAIMPVLDVQSAAMRRQAIVDYTKRMMVAGTDFGVIPGTGDKPTLLKPGAEKLASLFGLSTNFETMASEMDWTGRDHGDEPFFYMQYRCTLQRGDLVVGQGIGSCNSWEKKYRYRRGERVCPERGQPTIIKGRAEYGGGWLCFAKKGGCGHKYADDDLRITNQDVGQVKNPDPADIVNTIDKMAQKRAPVAAVLIAVNASELFTQDVEDYTDIVEGDWSPAPVRPAPVAAQPKQAATKKQPAPRPNNVDANGEISNTDGPLPDDEQVIAETSAADFISATAVILETDAATIKERLHDLGYTKVPGIVAKRLDAYRKLKAEATAPEQEPLQEPLFENATNGAYQD